MTYMLRISGRHYTELQHSLYPGDGKEAGAIALCGRLETPENTVFLVQEVLAVPVDAYLSREVDFLEWDTQWMLGIIDDAERKNLSLVKFHSHPSGGEFFSECDDATDVGMIREWLTWYDRPTPHGSAIMLPNGKLFGRAATSEGSFHPFMTVSVAGDHYERWVYDQQTLHFTDAEARNIQTFGAGTISLLKQLKIGVVGGSGTGSVVVEQLARLGVGQLTIVDPDIVEHKNLNRIINATLDDAKHGRFKVTVLAHMIKKMGFATQVRTHANNLMEKETVKSIASCDVIFGCVDGAEGRHILNRIASYYVIPYFDVGIDLQAATNGQISQITGAIHYIQPGGSSLLSRGVYSMDEVEAEALRRVDPETYAEHRKQNYIGGVKEDSPAVLPVNMHYASLLVLEFLARVHKYRITPDAELAVQQYNLEDVYNVYRHSDGEPCSALLKQVGRGDVSPILDMPGIS